ncbi:MAG TPA: hypothetical protein VFP41_03960, partial [Actinomycetota bacterium]|nr:hypothetical protein [Actinomycetota bacterium]
MSGGRALQAIRRGRRTFVILLLVCVALMVVASVLGARALAQAESQAQLAAKGLANAGIASVLEPGDVSSPLSGPKGRDLLARLQRGVLADGTAFRVRIWSPSGDLLFTSDAGDASDAVSSDLDAVYRATDGTGQLGSVRSGDEEVFATFVPLRLGQQGSVGAVEIDQGYEPIAKRAESPWSPLRTIGSIGAIVALALVAVASLPGAGRRTGGFLTPAREIALAKQRAQAGEAMSEAQERAKAAEEGVKEIERRLRDAEIREREAELRATTAETGLVAAQDEIRMLRGRAERVDSAVSADADSLRRLEEAEREVDELRGRLRAADALVAAAPSILDAETTERLESMERALSDRGAALEAAKREAEEAQARAAGELASVRAELA